MQFRRSMKSPVLLLLLAGVAASMVGSAKADVVRVNPAAQVELMKSKARLAKLRTNGAGDPDSVWIGHVVGSTGLPGTAGGAGPFHVGRGGALIGTGSVAGNNGYWDFDRLNAGEADTLQGWFPTAQPFQSVGGSNQIDRNRPFFGLDYGNQGNYRGNSFGKKTYGVLGYWHEDNGAALGTTIAGTTPVAPGWSTISGSKSAWCGVRAHGDLTVADPITGNAFNSSLFERTGDNHGVQVGSNSLTFTDANYPGYGDQWDQMLYRDFPVAEGASLQVEFKYVTEMSDVALTASNIRIGWFDKDPLKVRALSDGNFISSTDALTNAPVDSFMVYIGVPTSEAACAYTNTLTPTLTFKPIYDPQRRWFSEVLRIEPQGTSALPYYEVLSTWGINGTPATPISVNQTIGNAILQPLLDAPGNGGVGGGGTIRVVFRVKTNRTGSDEDGTFALSNHRGAVLLDDVKIDLVSKGDFETAGEKIDNATGTSPSDAWKSTGKPPGAFFHLHNLITGQGIGYSGLPYADPCGAIGAPARLCNMFGTVMTPGNHDNAEKPAGNFGANDQDHQDWLGSPTINLMSTGNGPGFYNGQGIDQEIADADADIWLTFDAYVNLLQFGSTGNGMRCAWQSYPALQANGVKTWGTIAKNISFSAYDGFTGCANGQNGISPSGAFGKSEGLIRTTNSNGVPDSLRAYIEHLSICYRRPVTAATCSPTTGPNVGLYIDNCSVGFIDGSAPPGIANQVWDEWNDAFPTNSDNSFVGVPAFDTLGANVRSGYNTGQQTGGLTRNAIPGDTIFAAAGGPNVRMDMVFRILPGPGNYTGVVPAGQHKIGQLKARPDQATAATSGDGSFWGNYLADVGLFGSGSPHTSAATMASVSGSSANNWDPDVWVSARLDTTELNLFPAVLVGGNVNGLVQGSYMSAYHEDDLNSSLSRSSGPQYGGGRASLGITKNRCILINTATGDAVDQTNIDCGSGTTPAGGTSYATKWVTYAANLTGGYVDPTCPGCTVGQTKEFTKLIPDGLLTAGAHVEYFYRKTTVGENIAFETLPDTTLIYPQPVEAGGNFDGHRWAEASILPDRWKDPALTTGSTLACMLVVDQGNRRGDDVIFDNMAGAIGLTFPARRGANNGYFVGATQDLPASTADLLPGQLVAKHLGQAGSVYDMYNVVAGESNVPSGRLGSRDAAACIGLATGKGSTSGPTKTMLRTYYRHLFMLATDLDQQVWGPLPDQTDDDIGAFTNFVTDPTPAVVTRTFIVVGRDIVKGTNTDHSTFFPTFFGATFRNDDYRAFSTNQNDAADLIPVAPVSTTGSIYGVFSPCFDKNDVLNVNTAVTGAAGGVFYENVGPGGPYIAGVYAPAGGTRIANTLVCGWTFGTFGSQGSRYTLSRGGHHIFWLNALTNIVGLVCGQPLNNPVGVENGSAKAFVSFMNLRSENPMRTGEARIAFGLTKSEKVEVKVYDVTGRLVKTVANRVFQGGVEHVVTWDGTNELGSSVSRGVYFYQLRSPSFTSEKKLTVLKD